MTLCAALAAEMLLLGTPRLGSQTTAKPHSKPSAAAASNVATIKSFRIVQEKDGPAVEILSSKPLVPAIQAITDPDRLVIDLPNARLETQQKRIDVQADRIAAIRADQFQQNPPVARVVVDLLAPRSYTWDSAGNRLVVHLGKNPSPAGRSAATAATVPSLTPAPQPLVSAVRAAGPLVLSGDNGVAGSSLTAGPDTAVLRLSSGGEVHVCPGTTVSVTPSQNRHNLMLSMNTGAMEAHLALDASSDSVMTPDFRILLVGPGEFHFAFSADSHGNTCVRALPGNTSAAIVSELLGDRTYQVKATDQLVFRSGQLDRVDSEVPSECGCPPPRDPALQATSTLPMQSAAQTEALPPVNTSPALASPALAGRMHDPEAARAESSPATGLPAAVAPPGRANEIQVQVEAPFVFHASGPQPAPVEDVRVLPRDSRPQATPPLGAALPPPAKPPQKPDGTETASANRPQAHGFFRRLGGFFAALFR